MKKFEEIFETLMRKDTDFERRKDSGDFNIRPVNGNKSNSLDLIRSLQKNDNLGDPEFMKDILFHVDQLQASIKIASGKGLPGFRMNGFKKKAVSNFIAKIEAQKAKTRSGLLDRLSKIGEQAKRGGDAIKELLELEKIKLSTKFMPEEKALAEMARMEREGYSPSRLLAMSAINEKTHVRAVQVRQILPEQFSSPEAISIIKRMEEQADLGVGQIGYKIKNKDFQNVVNVSDLIDPDSFTQDYEAVETAILSGSK